MSTLTSGLLELLAAYGPGLLFVMAIAETSFVTGLAVPSGLATSVATVLAGRGVMSYEAVALAAFAGGWIGDSVGFWIGARSKESLFPSRGRLGRAFHTVHERASPFLGKHPLYAVTLARLVSFVRTVMPLGAGVSGIPYVRFLRYELIGLVGWVTTYMAAGYLAGESWERAASTLGAGWTLAFGILGAVLILLKRKQGGK